MDFFKIREKELRGGKIEVYPDFVVGRTKDLMVRGGDFYAMWDEANAQWSTDDYDVVRVVDAEVYKYAGELKSKGIECKVKSLVSFESNVWNQFRKFTKNVGDNAHQLDMTLTFANTVTKRTDYSSKRLPYSIALGAHDAWDELVGVLYNEKERAKIEWAIGAVISGDAKKIEKFLVFYGPGGTGKSTVLKIIQKLFEGYYTVFEAKALVGNNNTFATESFKGNPLVAIQHDGDLSRIDDNSKLNSIISHEKMTMNEKYKSNYMSEVYAFLFMGTNKAVKITDNQSGIIRRLIDVRPSLNKVTPDRYQELMAQIEFELGAIAHHCLEVYKSMGKNYYSDYFPVDMMLQTNVFFNFVEYHFDILKNGVSLTQAYALYKEYCRDSEIEHILPRHKFRDELKTYYDEFLDRDPVTGVRSYFSGFNAQAFKTPVIPETKPVTFSLVMDEETSLFDLEMEGQPAQYANAEGNPRLYWTDEERLIDGVLKKPRPNQVVDSTLEVLDTTELHFVKVPENHIVIDFDLKDENGEKSLERNREAASLWPPTYAEVSKSGSGIHLHYLYTGGDPTELARTYADDIEIKVYTGNSSLRRKLSKCNGVPISPLSSGLPFKEKKKVLEQKTLQSELGLRDLINRNLEKKIHAGTKSSIDFIHKILEDAYNSGMSYDVTDMRNRIMTFANNSSNQPLNCLKIVLTMKFASDKTAAPVEPAKIEPKDDRLVIFDVEVYPNLFVVCWKYVGSPTTVRMINPDSEAIQKLMLYKLVGFYNRNYDNHILWGRMLGYNNEQLYKLSQKLINGKGNDGKFGEAYDLSYADIYDFSSVKMGLKKFQIKLGIRHREMDIPWDQPVPDDRINDVVEYCVNDVETTEKVLEDRAMDLMARQILADLSGLSVNDTTRTHATKIIFGNERNPQKDFVYTDLSKEFPGYKFDPFAKVDKSTYRGEVVGEGGYVYAEKGIHHNVVLLDVASMHPSSINYLNLFGPYTEKFTELMDARLAVKNASQALKDNNLDLARVLIESTWSKLGGRLKKYLPLPEEGNQAEVKKRLKALSEALKLVINSIYGYTSATFENPFKDKRNVDNIVAKRGALFMLDLKAYLQDLGVTVAHIKTDSVKIPNATPEIIEKVQWFGEKYGYSFNVEAVYEKLCLTNDAVYIAKEVEDIPGGQEVHWNATGAMFQQPYTFKKLFSGEEIVFDDLCITKSVVAPASLYLDYREIDPVDGMRFVGRTGSFVPVVEKAGGHLLTVKEGKPSSVQGTKGYLWAEAEVAKNMPDDKIDLSYFEVMAAKAIKAIEEFGDFKEFIS